MKFVTLALLVIASPAAFSWKGVDALVTAEMKAQHIPGAVVVVGTSEKILFKKAYGRKDVAGTTATLNTRYDMASLTKVMATTTAIMQLVEQEKLSLTQTLSSLYPELQDRPQGAITIEQILRHRAGLAATMELRVEESYADFIQRALTTPLVAKPNQKTHYSDLSFIILGAIIEKLSEKSLSSYSAEFVFSPLAMKSTEFSDKLDVSDCALAARQACRPHDPKAAQYYPHPLGHAGVFSTGEDLAKLAQFYLRALKHQEDGVLKASTVKKMVTLPTGIDRGLGWDLLSTLSEKPRGEFTKGISFGHTGFTGTSVWIDPKKDVYLILLTNRVLLVPNTSEHIGKLRRELTGVVLKQLAR